MINIENIEKKLRDCADMDINKIKIEDVDEITEIDISRRKDSETRIIEFLNKVKNPYFFSYKGKIIQIGFSESNKTAEECLTNVLKNLYR